MANTALDGKPYAGNPHVRIDEGDGASAKPRRSSLLYSCYSSGGTCAALSMTGTVAFDPMGVRGGCAFFDGRSWLSAPKVPAGIR